MSTLLILRVQGETIAILVRRLVPPLAVVALRLLLVDFSMFEKLKRTLFVSMPTANFGCSAKFEGGLSMLLV